MSPKADLLQFESFKNKSASAKVQKVANEIFEGPEPRDFPIASSVPTLPDSMRDEILDLYAFLFCQRGFRNAGITFEQFLLVITSVAPGELSA
jgi:hypothetical protein